MKKKTKIALGSIIGLSAIMLLSSCTKSFCNNTDTARALYAFDPGITRYDVGEESISVTSGGYTYTVDNISFELASFDNVKNEFYYHTGQYDSKTGDEVRDYTGVGNLNNIIKSARDNGLVSVTENQYDYFVRLDEMVLEDIMKKSLEDRKMDITLDLERLDEKGEAADLAFFRKDLSFYSYLKFVDSDEKGIWERWERYDKAIRDEIGMDKSLSTDFKNLYKNNMNSFASAYRTCLATNTDKYGSYGYSKDGIYVEAKSWSYAWGKGFFEGLLVYPIGWLIDQIAIGFSSLGSGPAALLAIFFVTLIIRGLMMLVTMKQTTGNAKMTELQPEITKIQNKYPNSNTNKYEKQRMAEEINALYKKNKINPLSTILVLIIQFPVFICVWGALSGASILTSGSVLGLSLSTSIKDAMFNSTNWTAAGGYQGVTAFILFLLMAIAQTVSMLLPQWMQKARAKKVARLGKNPAQKSQDNKMKWVTYIMLVVIIIMGFSLVSAMGVYWFVGAIISIGQTLITQAVTEARKKRN